MRGPSTSLGLRRVLGRQLGLCVRAGRPSLIVAIGFAEPRLQTALLLGQRVRKCGTLCASVGVDQTEAPEIEFRGAMPFYTRVTLEARSLTSNLEGR